MNIQCDIRPNRDICGIEAVKSTYPGFVVKLIKLVPAELLTNILAELTPVVCNMSDFQRTVPAVGRLAANEELVPVALSVIVASKTL